MKRVHLLLPALLPDPDAVREVMFDVVATIS